ncbi:hypothetical protein FBUS_01816 [Fasciolopsis buskii]|uniref:MAM domain-containing protein n=1 Tax=Fasciolopsis buskii TaxID=27845 RepID=A0A8E0RQ40_9TREM|nr:hypothetical protein FBUS_01816 [Fasciolopsis buski]
MNRVNLRHFFTVLLADRATARRSRLQSRVADPVNCTFEEQAFCGWNDDPRDVLVWWEIEPPSAVLQTHVACLLASPELGNPRASGSSHVLSDI